MMSIDHLLWAVPDLDAGIALLERLTGVTAIRGGAHPGKGTHNALAAFDDGRYLELIAPDPAQAGDSLPPGTLADIIRSMTAPGLLTYATQCSDLAGLGRRCADAGVGFRGPVEGRRDQPGGPTLHWQLGHPDGGSHDRLVPFAINWMDTPHPSTVAPVIGRLSSFEVVSPQHDSLHALYRSLDIDVPVLAGDHAAMRAVIAGPRGTVVLNGAA